MELDDARSPALARPRRRWPLSAALAILAAIAGMAAMAYAIRRSDRIATLVRPEAAVAVVAAVPTVPPAATPAPPPAAAPVAAVDPELAERLGRIEAQIDEIDSRAQEASGDADRAEGLLVAFAARRALDRGQPMGFLEPLLRRHFGGAEPQAVATIIGSGMHPVTLVQLEQRFDALMPVLRRPAGGGGWLGAVRRELAGLVVVRKTDEVPSQPADRLARAERALLLGHVDVALDEVAHLPDARAGGDWIAAARRYVLARSALDRIETAALLAPPAGSLPPAPAN